MTLEQEILSEFIIHNKYARYLEGEKRRESWYEIVDRNKDMHISKFPFMKEEIEKAYQFVYSKNILPSMRSMQFGGRAIELSPNRIYNCAFLPIDSIDSFSEIMFLLLGGTGVGFSVQNFHVSSLPPISKPIKSHRFLVGDSIEGWADAVKVLIRGYLDPNKLTKPDFDFSDIRPKGARLVTAGGKAPGAAPLKECLFKIEQILESKNNGDKLKPIEVMDIVCHIADAVLTGGIRRAALICLFNFSDVEMLTAKSGNWWELNPQRGRSNNSAVAVRSRITKDDFNEFWEFVENSRSGEPGIYFTNDKSWGTNPCCEIALRPYQFCNLCEIAGASIESQEHFEELVKAATLIGTLQASYTDFHYLRPIWQETTEKDALVGVGITGIASNRLNGLDKSRAAKVAKDENARVARLIGINPAARVTTVKPSGTSSLVVGSSSGIHAYHNDYYIRGIQINKSEAVWDYLQKELPYLVEEYKMIPNTGFFKVPIKAPEGAQTRGESTMELLERVKEYNLNWVQAGHRSGKNTNNVSATISVKDNEWIDVREWMWENRDTFNGLAVLPYDGGTYQQAPFTDSNEVEFNELRKHLNFIDLSQVNEEDDNTNLQNELACGPEGCEII